MHISTEGFVTGWVSWAGDESDPVFRARWNPSVRWNGWLCPFFDREQTQKLIDYNSAADNEYIDTLEWDGDILVMRAPASQIPNGDDPEEYVERIEPTELDGELHWTPGSFSWTWCEVFPPLTQDEAEAVGFDGRFDDRGVIDEGNLFPEERRLLDEYRKEKVLG